MSLCQSGNLLSPSYRVELSNVRIQLIHTVMTAPFCLSIDFGDISLSSPTMRWITVGRTDRLPETQSVTLLWCISILDVYFAGNEFIIHFDYENKCENTPNVCTVSMIVYCVYTVTKDNIHQQERHFTGFSNSPQNGVDKSLYSICYHSLHGWKTL